MQKIDTKNGFEQVENEIYNLKKPVVYGGDKGLLIKTDKGFDINCLALQQQGIQNPRRMPIREFYQAIELIEKQNKPKDGKSKKHRRVK